MKNRAASTLRLSLLAIVFGFSLHSAKAVNNTWDGGGANGNWDNITNWATETSIPTGSQTAGFTNNVNTTISLNGADRSVGSMSFTGTNTLGNFTFNASSSESFLLSSGGSILVSNGTNAGSVITYNVPLVLSGSYTLNNSNNQSTGSPIALIFNGGISTTGTSTLNLSGPGSGANKINGTISDGTGVLSILANPQGTIGSWELAGNNTFTGSVTKDILSSTFIISGSNAYLGLTTVNLGVLNIRNSNALGSTAAGTVVNATGRLELQGGITVGAEALTLNASAVGTVGSLRNISGDNTYGGLITLSAAARINSDSGNLTISNTGTITGATFGLTVGGAGNTSIASIIGTTTGGLTKDGAGTLILSGANTYNGTTTISSSGGTLVGIGSNAFGSTTGIGNNGTTTVLSLRGDTSTSFQKASDSSLYAVSTGASGATINVNQATVAGTSAKTMTIGTLALNAAVTNNTNFTGGNNTSLSIGAVTTGSAATGTETFTNTIGGGGSLTLASITTQSAGVRTLSFAGTGNTTVTGNITTSSGSAAVTISSTGTTTLNGVNTYTGNTTLTAGTAIAGDKQAFGTGGTLILNGGTLQANTNLSGANAIANAWSLPVNSTISGSNNLTLNGTFAGLAANIFLTNNMTSGANLVISNTLGISSSVTNRTFTFAGSGNTLISGNITNGSTSTGSALTITNTGVTTLSGTNNYNGTTLVNAGTLVFRTTAAKGNGTVTAAAIGSIGLGVGGTGDYSNANVATLFNTGTLTGFGSSFTMNATSGVAIDTTGGNFTQSTALTANRSLTKLGTNTLTLSGNSTYGGTTTVSAGTLLINGNNSAATGAFSVSLGATLGGNGTVGGATTILGNLQPGNSPGLLTFSSSLALNGTSTTTMEINGSTTRGTDYDGINVGTALTYGGNLTLAFGTTFSTGSYSFNLFDSVSQLGGFAGVTLAGNYSGTLTDGGGGVWGLTSGNNTWTFTKSTGDLGLSVVPEPATWALLAFGLTSVMVLRRRRA